MSAPERVYAPEVDDEPESCWRCHGDGVEIICIDDLCQHGCIHGDGEIVCRECGGRGVLP